MGKSAYQIAAEESQARVKQQEENDRINREREGNEKRAQREQEAREAEAKAKLEGPPAEAVKWETICRYNNIVLQAGKSETSGNIVRYSLRNGNEAILSFAMSVTVNQFEALEGAVKRMREFKNKASGL